MHKYEREKFHINHFWESELTQTYTVQEPVFFLLSARLNCNIPLERELLHNDNSKSGKQILMFFSGQGTTNTEILFLTHIWESECLGMGAYLHCVADSFPCDSLIAYY